MSRDKLSEFLDLRPAQFRFLESISLRRRLSGGGAGPFHVSLTLVDSLPPSTRLHLDFAGVRGLKIGDIDCLYAWFVEIRSVAESGLEEGLRFRVVESEHDSLSLWCQDFVARVETANPLKYP